MDKDSIQNLSNRITEYTDAREWEQFHTPKNLMMAINGEAGKLASLMQWENNSKLFRDIDLKSKVETKMADILIYLSRLSDVMEIDLIEAGNCRINTIDKRYPVDKCKGRSDRSEVYRCNKTKDMF